MRVGFVGLGAMGRPMARNLRRGGHEVVAYVRSDQGRRRAAEDGHRIAHDLAGVADGADAVILVLPDSPEVEQVLWAPGGVAGALRQGQLLVDMSTISPAAARRVGERVGGLGVQFVDAPVSGGVRGAESATLTIMAGGEIAAVDAARPLLDAMGATVAHLGGIGSGQVAKAANQMIVGGTIALVAEALAMVRAAGVDPESAREALLGGFAGSRILENHGARMLQGAFEPGFRVALQAKDLRIAVEEAGPDRAPMTRVARELYAALRDAGGADLDHAALWTLYADGDAA